MKPLSDKKVVPGGVMAIFTGAETAMKIGIDVRSTQLEGGFRGIGRYICDSILGMTRLAPQNEYILFAVPERPLHERLADLPSCCRVVALPTRYVGTERKIASNKIVCRAYCGVRRWQNARALCRLAARECLDVLHLTSVVERHFFSDGILPCPVVKTLYDLIPLVLKNENFDRWSYHHRYVYRRQIGSLRDADIVMAISESARNDAIKYLGLPPERIRVVPGAVPDDFRPVDGAERHRVCRQRYGIQNPYFLYCSGESPNKNRERVVQAFGQFAARHPEPYQLVLASLQTRESVLKTVAAAGLSRAQVVMTGYVPDEDLVTLFAGATALVTPSLYEGFGLPAAQAMGTGTPVIASDRSSHPEVVGDAGLQVDPYDTGAIAGAMRRIARDAGLRAELSARGLERVRRFRWHNQARALLDVYQSAASRTHS